MKRTIISIITIGVSFLMLPLVSCTKEDTELGMAEGIDSSVWGKSIYLTKSQQDLTASANVFAFKLFNQVRSERDGETLLLSPFSASMALGMTATGAEGETERQMRSILGFGSVTKGEMAEYYSQMLEGLAKADPYVDMKIANSIWIHGMFPVKEEFVKGTEQYFGSVAENRDFDAPETLKEINAWIEEMTGGTIKDFLDQLSSDTKVALVNALYFEGKWRYAFAGTKKGQFRNVSGGKRRTDMMYATGREVTYRTVDGWEMLQLPYGTGAFSMSIILPPEGEDFRSTVLDFDRWTSFSRAPHGYYEVNMTIPSFITSDKHDLIAPLKAMGMTLPFSAKDADFSSMAEKELYIGKVDQKTFIEVNETGTKASAATVVQMWDGSAGPGYEPPVPPEPESVNFDADRPFYYVISESSTRAVLFIGQVTDL